MRKQLFAKAAASALLRDRSFNMRWAQQKPGVIPLTAADTDFPIAEEIQEAVIRHVRDGVLNYGPPEGLPQFRVAVAAWFGARRSLSCTEADVLAVDGAAAALTGVARVCLRPGDEVLIPDPVDFLFAHSISGAGAVPVRVPLNQGVSAAEFVEALQARLTPLTRMLWLCHPHNPLGHVADEDWLRLVAEWAITHGLRILSDEVWSDIVYPPHKMVSVAALSPQIAEHTVTVYGFSKGFGLAGLRIGSVICTNPAWLKEIIIGSDVHSTVAGASVLSQVAATAAMNDASGWLDAFVDHLRNQRDYAVHRIRAWPQATVESPQGTFVLFPNLGGNTELLCDRLLQETGVALVPGAARWFGPGAAGHIRLSFATSLDILTQALDRLDRVLGPRAR